MHGLSKKEIETMLLVVEGKTNKEIAQLRYLSCRTIEAQVRAALRKIGGKRRIDLIVSYYKKNIYELHRC